MSRIVVAFILLLSITACQTKALIVDNFDSDSWNNSEVNCKGRLDNAQVLLDQREKLIGNSQEQIRQLLGTPDRHEIYKRSEKFIVYYIDPGQECIDGKPDSLRSYISIRFTSVGPAKEVLIHKF